jgi:streptogramin lyase
MLLLGGCHASAGDDRPAEAAAKTPGPAGWIDLAAEPADLLADPGGLWVTLGDHSVARFDTTTGRTDGPAVRLPFTPGAMTSGHGDLWVVGQLEGRRRISSQGNYPVIQLARVDPRRRRVNAVVPLPMRSNGNRLASTPTAVWVTDPAEGTQSRTWRVDPAGNRLVRPPLRVGEEPLAVETLGRSVWTANHDDGTLRRMDTATGALRDTIELGIEPHGMAVTRAAIWVADAHHDALLRIDPASGHSLARIPLGFEPGLLAVTRAAVWAVSSPRPELPGSVVARVDPAGNRVVATVDLAGTATALASDGQRVWVATSGPNAILRLPA